MNKNFAIVFLGLLIVIVLINGVSADSCSIVPGSTPGLSKSSIVMELSGQTNAHGAVYDDDRVLNTPDDTINPALYYLRCDFITPNPRQCSATSTTIQGTSRPSNKIIGLYTTSNSHAQIPNGNQDYTTNICYGDFEYCRYLFSGQTSCDAEEISILGLSSVTNSHIGGFNDYDNQGNGNYQICCKRTSSVPCTSDPGCDAVGASAGIEKSQTSVCSPDATQRIFDKCTAVSTCYKWVSSSVSCRTNAPPSIADKMCIDPAPIGIPDGNAQCQIYCGNGIKEGSETCDDGNTADVGDGCKNNCQKETGWFCDSSSPSKCLTMYWEDGSGIQKTSVSIGTNVKVVTKGSLVPSSGSVSYSITPIGSGSLVSSGSLRLFQELSVNVGKGPWTATPAGDYRFMVNFGGTLGILFSNAVNSAGGVLTVTSSGGGTCDNDGIKESGEQCDGSDFGLAGGSNLCSVYNSDYTTGILQCTTSCVLDIGNCGSGTGTCDGTWRGTLGEAPGTECDGTSHCDPMTCMCENSPIDYGPDGSGGCIEDVSYGVCDNRPNTADGCYLMITPGVPYANVNGCPATADYVCKLEGPNCVLGYDNIQWDSTSCSINPDTDGCKWLSQQIIGSCDSDDEVRIRSVIDPSTPIGIQSQCTASDQVRICPRKVKIPFFTIENVAIAIGLIILIYIIVAITKRRKKITSKIRSVRRK